MQSDLKRVLFREDEIAARLDQLAIQITEDYRGKGSDGTGDPEWQSNLHG